MGHMSCLKRARTQSKRDRKREDDLVIMMELFLHAMALELHGEKDPYGLTRLNRVTDGIVERILTNCDFYEPDFALEGLKEQCRRFGYEVKIR